MSRLRKSFFGASNNIPKPDGTLKRTVKALASGAANLGIHQLNRSGNHLAAAALNYGAGRLTR